MKACKVISVNPAARTLVAQEIATMRTISPVNILDNGQSIPAVGDTIIVDDSIRYMPICLGKFVVASANNEDIFGQTEDDRLVEPSELQYSSQPINTEEGDWVHYNPVFHSLLGTMGNITALINDAIKLILDSANESISAYCGSFNLKTKSYTIDIGDTQTNSPIFKILGTIEEGSVESNIEFVIDPSDTKNIIFFNISSQYGESFRFSLSKDGKLSLNNKGTIDINGEQILATVKALSLIAQSDISIEAGRVSIIANQLILQISGSVTLTVLGKLNIFSPETVSVNSSEINITASGNPVSPLPSSKKLVLKSSNGSIEIAASPIGTPSANSSVIISGGYPDVVVDSGIFMTPSVGIFASGGVILGGPLPTPIGINSFVKYNEFASLMSALMSALTLFATVQATASSSGSLLPLAAGFSGLATAVGAIMPLILACKSITVTTGEP